MPGSHAVAAPCRANPSIPERAGGLPAPETGTVKPIEVLALHWYDTCSPWRITIPLGALGRLGYRIHVGRADQPADLTGIDLLVIHRPVGDQALATIEQARERGTPVVADVDDLFLPGALPEHAPMAYRWHPLYYRREAEKLAALGLGSPGDIATAPHNDSMERFHRALALASLVTVTTTSLADAYRAFNPHIRVLPNAYDDANPLWDLARRARETVHIGFAGTDHHMGNLALLQGVLEPILRAHPEARVVEAGGPELLPRIDAPVAQLVHLGTMPFEAFPLLVGEMDIVLAPLADEPFMRGKSNIRCLMAGLVGAPVVASPVGPYADYISHGVNGYLAQDTRDWTQFIGQLVADPNLRRAMGAANRERAQRQAISRAASRWQETYDALLRDHRRA